MLNLLEANLLFKEELASPAMARHHCLSLWAAEASALLSQDCYIATHCLAYICGAGYFCLSSGSEICLQGLYKHFPGCVTGPRGRMLGSQVAWFPKPQRFGNCFLKHAHQNCWWGAERRQWQKCVTTQTCAFAFIQLNCQKSSLKYYLGLTVAPCPWWFFTHTSAQGVDVAFHLTLSMLKWSIYYKVA